MALKSTFSDPVYNKSLTAFSAQSFRVIILNNNSPISRILQENDYALLYE